MKLTENDVVCSPPPLFHCFGLVMGFLASFYYGSSIVFPADSFDPVRTVKAIVEEKATAILGVPTMYIAELDALEKTGHTITTIRTGLASGSPVAPSLMTRLRERMNVPGMLIAYGMTETSPVTFLTSLDDSDDRMFNTVGRVFPHTGAKVVDSQGRIVPCGVRGELCVSGFALQKGYYKDDAKTKEVMRQDKNGVVWMHTGDEGYLDKDGFGHITGRIKDLIIRGTLDDNCLKQCTHPRVIAFDRQGHRSVLTNAPRQVAKTFPPPRSKAGCCRTPPSERAASSASRTKSTAKSSPVS